MTGGQDANVSRFLLDMVEQAAREDAAEAAGSVLAAVRSETRVAKSVKKPKEQTMTTRNEIKNLLASNDFAVERALLVMLDRQTQDERSGSRTKHSNGIGFNRNDAEKGTSLAEWVKGGRRLTIKQLVLARDILGKYVGQLVDAANEKAARVEAQRRAADIF